MQSGSFPSLRSEMDSVGVAEMELVYAEKKFLEFEPLRLDEQLKRCRQLTATLLTLKKLATVQEARSKTPVTMIQIPPHSHENVEQGSALANLVIHKRKILEDVRGIEVDHNRRNESIKEAEISWKRKRKFAIEHDSRKFEKALEVAERALKRTNFVHENELRRQACLVEHYKAEQQSKENNLSASETSSIDSLPQLPELSDIKKIATSTSRNMHSKIPPPFSKRSSSNSSRSFSSNNARISKSYLNSQKLSGSLPRRAASFKQTTTPNYTVVDNHNHFQSKTEPPERSKSVPPHLWSSGHFQGATSDMRSDNHHSDASFCRRTSAL